MIDFCVWISGVLFFGFKRKEFYSKAQAGNKGVAFLNYCSRNGVKISTRNFVLHVLVIILWLPVPFLELVQAVFSFLEVKVLLR